MKAWPCLKRNEALNLDEWLIRAKMELVISILKTTLTEQMKNANNGYIIVNVLLDKDEQVRHAWL